MVVAFCASSSTHKGVGQRAPAHEGQRRDLDPLFLDQLLHLLLRQEVVQRVVERLHVGIDLVLHVAGQEAQPFARLHRRARQDDLVDMPADEHGHARRPRPDRSCRCPPGRCRSPVHGRTGWRHRPSAPRSAARPTCLRVRSSYLRAREHLDLLVLAAARSRIGRPIRSAPSISPADHALARFQPRIKRPQHRRRLFPRALVADHRQPVAPPQDMHPHLVLDLGKVAVKFAAKVDQQSVVGKFQKRFDDVFRTGRGGQRADAQGWLLLHGASGWVSVPSCRAVTRSSVGPTRPHGKNYGSRL